MGETTNDVIVGIDLGTTNYSVSICNNKQSKALKDEWERFRTPCFVYFCSKDCSYVGAEAKNLENQIGVGFYDAKRFLGREYNDTEVQALIPRMRYSVKDDSNKPVLFIKLPNGRVSKTPIEICSLILAHIKKDIEFEMNKVCNIKAVITVPANFNQNQRNDTLEAARLADLHVLGLLDEPKATASLYFSFHKNFQKNDIFLIYNLGGSAFNIAIINFTSDNTFDTVTASDTNVSGQEFDEVIFSYLWAKLNDIFDFSKSSNADLTALKRQLRIKSEEIKIQLSYVAQSYYSYTYNNSAFAFKNSHIRITRKKFENLAQHLLEKTVDLVDRCLQQKNLDKSLIKRVILCGGLANMPKIKEVLKQYFREVPENLFLIGDTTVAEGAARHAKSLSKKQLQ